MTRLSLKYNKYRNDTRVQRDTWFYRRDSITPKEYAKLKGYSYSHVITMCRIGKIDAYKFNGRWRIWQY